MNSLRHPDPPGVTNVHNGLLCREFRIGNIPLFKIKLEDGRACVSFVECHDPVFWFSHLAFSVAFCGLNLPHFLRVSGTA